MWWGALVYHLPLAAWLFPLLIAALATLRWPRIAAVLVLCSIGCGVSAWGTHLRTLSLDELPSSRAARFEVIVTGDPRITHDRVVGQNRISGRVVMPVRVQRVIVDGEASRLRVPARLLLTAPMDLTPGECLQFTGRAFAGDRREVLITDASDVVGCGDPPVLQKAAAELRRGLQRAAAILPADARGLLPGLVEGDTTALDPSLEAKMREVNLTHLTAVSGANLAIVAAFILALSRGVGLRRSVTPVVVTSAIAFFVILARPDPSVLRAAVMASVLIVARILGSAHAAFTALAVAVILIVLVNPEQAHTAGFILSVCATGGLILWVAPIAAYLNRWMPQWLSLLVAVPIAAQAACTPFLVAISGQLSLIGVLANLAAAPLVAPATVLGLIAAILSPIWLPGAHAAAALAGIPVLAIAAIARICAKLPFAAVAMPSGGRGALLALVMTLAVIIGLRIARFWTAILVTSLLLALSLVSTAEPGWPIRGWRVAACDVGQGDGLVIRTADDRGVIVDVGPDGSVMIDCLRRLGIRHVPLLVITHAHADHMEGLPQVLSAVRVAQIVMPFAHDPVEQFERLLTMSAGTPTRTVRAGERFTIDGVTIDVIWPRSHTTLHGANNLSTVLLVTADQIRYLLLADVEKEAQESLPPLGKIDVLKVAHHGSGNQFFELLDLWHPHVGVVSVGADNPYSHPHPTLLNALTGRGIATFRTDEDGTIALAPREQSLLVARRGHPFWDRRR